MAEVIGIDNGAIGRIERAEASLKTATSALNLQAIGQIAGQLEVAVQKVLANIQEVATFAGLDPEETRHLRQGLETVEGGLQAGKTVLPYALALRGPAGAALLAGAAILGAAGGSRREAARRQAAASSLADADAEFAIRQRVEAQLREVAESQAARKRARSIR